MKKEIPKIYDAAKVEDDIYRQWEESGLFNPEVCIRDGFTSAKAEPFTIVLPPPNVTGTLHLGHASMLAFEDIMVRYHRMKGDRTLWIPGTDHAAIATQSKVEKILWDKNKQTRHDLGRKNFLKLVEGFASESHDIIVHQTKKMGASLDWSREAFTLDEPRTLAVRTAFKKMYDDGIIYRGHRLVNWDPRLQTTVSDDEVEYIEKKSPFYYLKYGPFTIATARPETKFGDKYVVVHPRDKRYKKYKHGQKIDLEWINGPVTATVIKDEAIEMELGTGAMTITPWHDLTDFEIAGRHNLDKEQIIDFDGQLLPLAGEFAGMDIKEARQKIVSKLEKKGLIEKVDQDYLHNVAANSRGGGLIEPQIMEQWFIDVNKEFKRSSKKVTLKILMKEAVNSGKIKIIPERFTKVYYHWIDNLRDWCISRQIWYGHQVPVWYKKKFKVQSSKFQPKADPPPADKVQSSKFKATDENAEEIYVGLKEPEGEGWRQDSDTLDTWFSSGLWTFSTLGWPEETEDLKTYHPTTVLETGYDILFFWVARMILMTEYLLGEAPFKYVYLHGLVRDEQGRKMSKSLDNIIDPLDMILKYGTDPVRLSLVVGTAPGNDLRLYDEKIAGYRNFVNKLWNISRYILLTVKSVETDTKKPRPASLADKWILSRLNRLKKEVTDNIEQFNFSYAAEQLYDFTWQELADWYVEVSKIEGQKDQILIHILKNLLRLWHPYTPYVTEEIWKNLNPKNLLMVSRWPAVDKKLIDKKAEKDFELIRQIITAVRNARAENKIAPAKKIKAVVYGKDQAGLIEDQSEIIKTLARLSEIEVKTGSARQPPGKSIGVFVGKTEIYLPVSDLIDLAQEKARLEKELGKMRQLTSQLDKKLKNKKF
ncbi:MAG TPA: valine--tRNA ligase, partial [Patescibacteria group bacterium]